jgi:nitroreductase
MEQRTPFQTLVWERRSVRHFLDTPVERDKVLACLEAARLAPSAHNVQPCRYLVIDDDKIKDAFGREAFSGIYSATKFALKAPVLVLILSKPDLFANRIGKQIQRVAFHLIDIGIAGEHLVLAAQEQGLGTCWIGWFNPRRARKFFKIPRAYKPVAIVALGACEKREPRDKKRKPLSEVAWFNKFGG